MRKNQKYSQEEMYLAIEMWQESGLSQYQFCNREKLAKATFSYWLRKYRKEHSKVKPFEDMPVKSFLPVEVINTSEPPVTSNLQIEIIYPNGIQVRCPASIDMHQLKTLINI